MQLCSGQGPYEVINYRVADVLVDGVGGSLIACPTDKTRLFTLPNQFSLCGNDLIGGTLLASGDKASFIIKSLEMPMLISAALPFTHTDIDGNPETCLGQDPQSVAFVLLLAQFLVNTVQMSLFVDDRPAVCGFMRDFPQAGGLVADLSGVTTCCQEIGNCNAPGAFFNVNNGVASRLNRYNFDPPIGIKTGGTIRGEVEFDCVSNSEGNTLTALDLLQDCKGNQSTTCLPTTCPPELLKVTNAPIGLLVKVDVLVEGMLARYICR